MPLETATFITDLNTSNPAHTDQLNQADAHMRLIKGVLKATFPNFTSAAVNSTQAQLDASVAATTNGAAVLADAGAFFKTNTTDGVTNPSAGEVDIKAGGVVVAKFKSDGTLTIPGVIVTGSAGTFPICGSMPWFTDTLPATGGTWAWLNGQAVSRATYAGAFALLSTTYGPGDGSTTFNLPDTRDNVLVGKGTMGGTSAVGRITNFVTTTIGTLFGECLHLLGIGEMPSHTHTANVTDPGHHHSYNEPTAAAEQPGGTANTAGTPSGQTTGNSTTGISVANTNTGGGTSHNNVQPSLVCNWIMRIA